MALSVIRKIIGAVLSRRASGTTVETLGHPAAGVIGWFDSSDNLSGVIVNEQTALSFSAVWCATRIIAETLAGLPCILYRRLGDGSRERAVEDPRYWLLHDSPHPAIGAYTFFETLTSHVVLRGNCYARIGYTGGGKITKLTPALPDDVTPVVAGDSMEYRFADGTVVPAADMLHVLGLSSDGLVGYSVVAKARESIGAAVAAENMAAAQFGNGSVPQGALVFPQRLNKDARETFRREWEDVHGGSSKRGKVAILHGGLDFKPIPLSNEDAQFLQSREYSVREISRWFRLPPHMLGDLKDSSVRANIEQQAIEFVKYSLSPWLRRWETELNRKLLSLQEQKTMYFEFLLNSLLRGDVQTRFASYATARQWGWLSINEIRAMENLNAIDGGDAYMQPVNMISIQGAPDNAAIT